METHKEKKNNFIRIMESSTGDLSYRKIYVDYPLYHISRDVINNFNGEDIKYHRPYYNFNKISMEIVNFLGVDVKDKDQLLILLKNNSAKLGDIVITRNDYINDIYLIGDTMDTILKRLNKFDNDTDNGAMDNRIHIVSDKYINYYGVLYSWIPEKENMYFIPRVRLTDNIKTIKKREVEISNKCRKTVEHINISKKKRMLWNNTYGNCTYSYCDACGDPLSIYSFDNAHKTSKKMLGNDDIENLIAICSHCNKKMNIISYNDYKKDLRTEPPYMAYAMIFGRKSLIDDNTIHAKKMLKNVDIWKNTVNSTNYSFWEYNAIVEHNEKQIMEKTICKHIMKNGNRCKYKIINKGYCGKHINF